MKSRFSYGALSLAALSGALTIFTVCFAPATQAATQSISLSGTSSPQTGGYTPSGDGDATFAEFPGQLDEPEGPGPFPGIIVNRSLSQGVGSGPWVPSGPQAKSHPQLNMGFEGLNHYQQRYSRGGNQFSVEPPDQGLCAGNGFVLEAVNDVFNVFDAATGNSALPDNTATNIVSGHPRN